MRFAVVTLGLIAGLVAQAGQKNQGTVQNQPSPGAGQVFTGCVDEDGAGHYVLLDDHLQKFVSLETTAPVDQMFARFMGHEVRIKGTRTADQKDAVNVTSIEQIADSCRQSQ
jgi:hypothetical protein